MSNKLFLRFSLWHNDTQDYVDVGTLVYDNNPMHRFGFIGFSYDKEYMGRDGAALDPAHLVSDDKNKGRFFSERGKGRLMPYFAAFLPGQFGQSLLSTIDKQWSNLGEVERLFALSSINSDFGAIQINPHLGANDGMVRSYEDLSRVAEAIRQYMNGGIEVDLPEELKGSICVFGGVKPKVNFQAPNDSKVHYVARINSSRMISDAKVVNFLTQIEKNCGINACDNLVKQLDCGEDVLLSKNYSHIRDFSSEKPKIYRYNRVSFKVLLSDNDILKHTEKPKYRHLSEVIKRYSASPKDDQLELFRRAVYSALVNHTSNGMDNLEMYDTGNGQWRLSPSFHNLCNPEKNTEFAVGFIEPETSAQTLQLNSDFFYGLIEEIGVSEQLAIREALHIINEVARIPELTQAYGMRVQDAFFIKESIHQGIDSAKLTLTMMTDPYYKKHLAKLKAETAANSLSEPIEEANNFVVEEIEFNQEIEETIIDETLKDSIVISSDESDHNAQEDLQEKDKKPQKNDEKPSNKKPSGPKI